MNLISQDSIDSLEAIFPSVLFKQLLMFFEELEEKNEFHLFQDRREDEFVFYVGLKNNSKKTTSQLVHSAFLNKIWIAKAKL